LRSILPIFKKIFGRKWLCKEQLSTLGCTLVWNYPNHRISKGQSNINIFTLAALSLSEIKYSRMPEGGCLCGNIRVSYTGDPIIQVCTRLICLIQVSLNPSAHPWSRSWLTWSPTRASATVTTVAKSVAAHSAPIFSSQKVASVSSKVSQKPLRRKPIAERASKATSATRAEPRALERASHFLVWRSSRRGFWMWWISSLRWRDTLIRDWIGLRLAMGLGR
jgi:hypothetical protein